MASFYKVEQEGLRNHSFHGAHLLNNNFAAIFFGATTFLLAGNKGKQGPGLCPYRRLHACWYTHTSPTNV